MSEQSLYQNNEHKSLKRLRTFQVGVLLLGAVVLWRLFSLQVLSHGYYEARAEGKHQVERSLLPQRGSIFLKLGDESFPVVTNKDYFLVYAEPSKIHSPARVVDTVTPILGLETQEWHELLGRLNDRNDPYEPIKRKVPADQVAQLEKADLDGVGWLPETYRFYPERNIGGHVFGFIGFQGDEKVGQYGLEGHFDKELKGESGFLKSTRDALGALIAVGERSVRQALNGDDFYLTIEQPIQLAACARLKEFSDYFQAEGGSVTVLDPKTGAVLAMCGQPDFEPAQYNEVENITAFNNPSIFHAYEPGSVFKPVTMAAALDVGDVEPTTTYIDEGEVEIGPFTIRNADFKAHGEQTMTQVLEKSLNTGTIFLVDKMGKGTFKRYVKRFGFGEATGIQLDQEVAGDISSLDKRGDIFSLTGSYGQGLTVTPLQLASAFGAIANGGTLMKPYIVDRVVSDGGRTSATEPDPVKQVISSKTSRILSGMLVSVVENGFGEKAGVPGYYLAGKTGTAQVAGEGGRYGEKTIHTFAGYGPVGDPKFVMVVRLDNPKDINFASDSVAPLFKQIAEVILNYFEVEPDYLVTNQ